MLKSKNDARKSERRQKKRKTLENQKDAQITEFSRTYFNFQNISLKTQEKEEKKFFNT